MHIERVQVIFNAFAFIDANYIASHFAKCIAWRHRRRRQQAAAPNFCNINVCRDNRSCWEVCLVGFGLCCACVARNPVQNISIRFYNNTLIFTQPKRYHGRTLSTCCVYYCLFDLWFLRCFFHVAFRKFRSHSSTDAKSYTHREKTNIDNTHLNTNRQKRHQKWNVNDLFSFICFRCIEIASIPTATENSEGAQCVCM